MTVSYVICISLKKTHIKILLLSSYSQLHDRAAFFDNDFFFFLEQDFLLLIERHFPIAAKISDLKKQNTNFEQNSLRHTNQTK